MSSPGRKEEMKIHAPRRKTVLLILGVIVLLCLFALVYVLSLQAYQEESNERAAPFITGTATGLDRVDIEARIVTIDPIKGEMSMQILMVPQGRFAANQGALYGEPLLLYTPGVVGTAERTFQAGEPVAQLDIVYSLFGEAMDYPYDEHLTQMWLILGQGTTPADLHEVPVRLEVYGRVAGFQVTVAALEESTSMGIGYDLLISRSRTVVLAAEAGMVVEWAIGIGVLVLIAVMLSGWYNIRILAVYATLLFGLLGLRNSLPGTPPIGTYSDYLSFLWVELIVAVAMVVGLLQAAKRKLL
jgi:hypothetical protein